MQPLPNRVCWDLLAAPAAASFDPLAAGLRLLRGEPAQRLTSLNQELAQVRERLDTLRPAVEAQRAVVAAVKIELSALATPSTCADAHRPGDVADALENYGLRWLLDCRCEGFYRGGSISGCRI